MIPNLVDLEGEGGWFTNQVPTLRENTKRRQRKKRKGSEIEREKERERERERQTFKTKREQERERERKKTTYNLFLIETYPPALLDFFAGSH